MSTLGERLKELRAGLTQAEFAALLGVHGNTIKNWEKGTHFPDYKILMVLVEKYELSVKWLMLGIEPKHHEESEQAYYDSCKEYEESFEPPEVRDGERYVPRFMYDELAEKLEETRIEEICLEKKVGELTDALEKRTSEVVDAYKLLLRVKNVEGQEYLKTLSAAIAQLLVKYPSASIPVDPEVAEFMGAFREDAISPEDIDDCLDDSSQE